MGLVVDYLTLSDRLKKRIKKRNPLLCCQWILSKTIIKKYQEIDKIYNSKLPNDIPCVDLFRYIDDTYNSL